MATIDVSLMVVDNLITKNYLAIYSLYISSITNSFSRLVTPNLCNDPSREDVSPTNNNSLTVYKLAGTSVLGVNRE